MTKYKYRAIDSEGRGVEDTLEAPSAHGATRKLQERGLTVNSLEEAYPDKGLLRLSKRLQWNDLQLLSEQLAAILKSGLPLVPSLRALSSDLRHPRLRPVLEGLHDDLNRGVALEDAIERQHEAFPPVYPALIRAGEASGNLPGVLNLISDHANRMVDLKQRIQVAMIYPSILLVLASVVLGFLIFRMVPMFAETFLELGGRLPAPTRLLLWISDVVIGSWHIGLVLLLGLVVGGFILYGQLMRSQRGRCQLELLRMYAPWSGTVFHLVVQARFCRMMSLLLSSQVPVLDALELSAAGSGSSILERASEEAVLGVASGESISDSLESTRYFGHDVIWLLATSEERGHAEEAFESLANRFEREVAARDAILGAIVGPTFVILLGLVIGFIVVSIYLPIFSLGDMVGV